MEKDVLLQALHGIALKRIEGGASTDMLIKACDAYKLKTEFDEGYDYHVIVSKSIYDQLNGVPQDEELCKAILPGQTTVIDGVLYVWEPTKVGSVTQYGWHVAQKNIGKGGSLTAQRIAQLEKDIEDRDNIIMGQNSELETLRQFKKDVEDKEKAISVEAIMAECKEYMSDDCYKQMREEGMACEFADVDAWANKVKAYCFSAVKKTPKKEKTDVFTFAAPVEKKEHKGLWD